MELPEITPSNQKAINVLTQYTVESLDPMTYLSKFALKFKNLSDDPRYSKPLYPDFEDYDYLHDTSKLKPIYLNDLDLKLEEDRELLGRLTRMEFNGNTFDTVAQCTCGHLRGNYRIRAGNPQICLYCGDPVEKFFNRGNDSKIWLKVPEGVDRFVNLGFYSTFFSNITVGSPIVCIPRYFMDKDYRRTVDKAKNTSGIIVRTLLQALDIQEINMNTFYRNADRIMEWILVGEGRRYFKNSKEGQMYMDLWERNKHIAFPRYMKVPNRYSTVLEKSGKETFAYSYQPVTASLYISLTDTLKSNTTHRLTEAEKDKNVDVVGRTLCALAQQYVEVNNPTGLFLKTALNRKHVGSGSTPFTGRTVITSMTGIIDPDALIVPWKICISILEIHIKSYLYRKGHTPKQAKDRIAEAAYQIDPLIDEFFKDMEDGCKALVQSGRNPTIEYLSFHTFKLRVNRDLEDESIKLPILSTKMMNAKHSRYASLIRRSYENRKNLHRRNKTPNRTRVLQTSLFANLAS